MNTELIYILLSSYYIFIYSNKGIGGGQKWYFSSEK